MPFINLSNVFHQGRSDGSTLFLIGITAGHAYEFRLSSDMGYGDLCFERGEAREAGIEIGLMITIELENVLEAEAGVRVSIRLTLINNSVERGSHYVECLCDLK
jgi:hypothetical protein